MSQYHIARDSQQLGVFSEQEIQQGITTGRFQATDLCWTEGMAEWQPLSLRLQISQPVFTSEPSVSPAAFNPYAAPLANVTRANAAGVELADQGKRLGGALIDILIGGVVTGIPYFFFIMEAAKSGGKSIEETGPTPVAMLALACVVLGGLALLVVQGFFLTKRGQTLGKMCVGIRVVTFPDAQKPGFVKAVLLRLIVNSIICAMPCCTGVIYYVVDCCFVFRDDRRCIHDLIAGTQVIEGNPPKD